MVRFRQHFFLLVFATMLIWNAISAQEAAKEDPTAVKPNPNRKILGSWRGGPEGMQEATLPLSSMVLFTLMMKKPNGEFPGKLSLSLLPSGTRIPFTKMRSGDCRSRVIQRLCFILVRQSRY